MTRIRPLSPPGRVGVLTGLTLPLLLAGCQSIQGGGATSRPAEKIDRIEQTQAGIAARVEAMETRVTGIESDMRFQAADISAVKGVLDVKINKSVVNDVWPWLLSGLAAILLLGGTALLMVRIWIRGNSYLKQKPLYEQRKLNSTPGTGPRNLVC